MQAGCIPALYIRRPGPLRQTDGSKGPYNYRDWPISSPHTYFNLIQINLSRVRKRCVTMFTEVMPVYPRLRDLREDSDRNQTELAAMLGMSQTGYSKYETGENEIPVSILIKLADIYQTSTDYLLGRTDVKTPYPKK